MTGTVYLVGAGPGDPSLLTLRAAALLRQADVVVYDRLVHPAVLDLAPPGAERVPVGKWPGGGTEQEEIHRLLVDRARRAKTVVRLQGGDPLLFGRGGEEIQALAEAGIPWEVVPGVTSPLAAAASLGAPLTCRGTSSTVVITTARRCKGAEPAWDALAACGGTLVFLMSAARAAEVSRRLLQAGMSPDTPTAAVMWATWPCQRTVRTRLSDLGDEGHRLEPPAVILVGEALREPAHQGSGAARGAPALAACHAG